MVDVPKKKKFGVLDIAKYFIFAAFAIWAFTYIKDLTSKDALSKVFAKTPWWVYFGAFIGALINWLLESAKWHRLINTIQISPLATSIKAVLSGTAVGNLLPYKIGEYLGKLYFVDTDKRALSIPLSFISSTIQLFVNLSLCIIPAIYVLGNAAVATMNWQKILIIGSLAILSFSVAYQHPKLKKWMLDIRENFKLLTLKVIFQVSAIALLRFLFFLSAYAFVLHGMTELSWTQLYSGICAIYFMQSFAPGMLLTDGPVRILLPLVVFKAMGANETVLIAASIINYLASVIFPSLVGVVLITLRKR